LDLVPSVMPPPRVGRSNVQRPYVSFWLLYLELVLPTWALIDARTSVALLISDASSYVFVLHLCFLKPPSLLFCRERNDSRGGRTVGPMFTFLLVNIRISDTLRLTRRVPWV